MLKQAHLEGVNARLAIIRRFASFLADLARFKIFLRYWQIIRKYSGNSVKPVCDTGI